MKFNHTTLHVFEDGINDEFIIEFSYNPEVDREPIAYLVKGRWFILHGINFVSVLNAAIMQENYVRALDGELEEEVSQEDNHIYFNINDYASILSLGTNYFKENTIGENKELKLR